MESPITIRRRLKFSRLPGKFAVCRLSPHAPVPDWAQRGSFSSVTRSGDELSVVCAVEQIPLEHRPQSHWTCFKLEGPFAFSEVGVLASFIGPLVDNDIPIFAISTFDTDYVLVDEDKVENALQTLHKAGHELLRKD